MKTPIMKSHKVKETVVASASNNKKAIEKDKQDSHVTVDIVTICIC